MVTNWTPADYRRRLDIPVNVAYGTAPDKVLQVLIEVAKGHPDIIALPAPVALFLGFGDSALQFQIRAWTNRLDRHLLVRSELGVAVYAAHVEEDIHRKQVFRARASDPLGDARLPGRQRPAPLGILGHHAARAIGHTSLV